MIGVRSGTHFGTRERERESDLLVTFLGGVHCQPPVQVSCTALQWGRAQERILCRDWNLRVLGFNFRSTLLPKSLLSMSSSPCMTYQFIWRCKTFLDVWGIVEQRRAYSVYLNGPLMSHTLVPPKTNFQIITIIMCSELVFLCAFVSTLQVLTYSTLTTIPGAGFNIIIPTFQMIKQRRRKIK